MTRTHGKHNTPIYKTWQNMKNRCLNKKIGNYKHYGARGITVCERWMVFENFYEDMGDRPSRYYSIDRIDNDGNYEPSNCRWATKKDQARNTRVARKFEFDGKKQTLPQWADEYGFSKSCLEHRVYRMGMYLEEAITTPLRYKKEEKVRLTKIGKSEHKCQLCNQQLDLKNKLDEYSEQCEKLVDALGYYDDTDIMNNMEKSFRIAENSIAQYKDWKGKQ